MDDFFNPHHRALAGLHWDGAGLVADELAGEVEQGVGGQADEWAEWIDHGCPVG